VCDTRQFVMEPDAPKLPANVAVCMDVDGERIKQLYLERVLLCGPIACPNQMQASDTRAENESRGTEAPQPGHFNSGSGMGRATSMLVAAGLLLAVLCMTRKRPHTNAPTGMP